MMRVLIDDEGLEEGAVAWWRGISPAMRAHFVQVLWECGHGAAQGDNPHEDAIRVSNDRDRGETQ